MDYSLECMSEFYVITKINHCACFKNHYELVFELSILFHAQLCVKCAYYSSATICSACQKN